MAFSFPSFHGATGEGAEDFCDSFELVCITSGHDTDAMRLRAFPLVMKSEAKAWFNDLEDERKATWAALRAAFLQRYQKGQTPEERWQKLSDLKMTSLEGYTRYETRFVELWNLWVASLGEGGAAPDFLKKDKFMAGLCEPLREKVRGKFPATYAEAVETAKRKKRKLYLQNNPNGSLSDHEGCAQHYPEEQWRPPPAPAPQGAVQQRGGNQQEILERITHQLENLSVNLVGGRGQNANHDRGNRRQQGVPHCYNCGEDGHGMYYCPHPRRYQGDRNPRGGR